MSANVKILLYPYATKKVRKWIRQIQVHEVRPGQVKGILTCSSKADCEPAYVRVELKGNKLQLEYSGRWNGDFATAVGQEIIKTFKARKAGWDSIGYCKTVADFMKAKPMAHMIKCSKVIVDQTANGNRTVVLRRSGYTFKVNNEDIEIAKKEIVEFKQLAKDFRKAARCLLTGEHTPYVHVFTGAEDER